MVHAIKTAKGAATRAEGTFTKCGINDNDFELSYRCEGLACPNLDASLQNVVCHKDGNSRLICSSDSKCQRGTPSYQSNFTFSQNEPDHWSPQMANEPDTWVPQDQHILIGGCAGFTLTSDGTQEGTQIDDGSQTDHCPNVKVLPSPSTWAKHTSATTDYSQAALTQSPLVLASTANCHGMVSKSSKLLAFFLMASLLIPEVQASIVYRQGAHASREVGVSARTGSSKVLVFAKELRSNIERRAKSEGFDGKHLATRLVADTVSSVCQDGSQGPNAKNFAPRVIKDCIASVYASDPWPHPGIQFLAIFGGSLLCDYVVSETYPSGRQFLPERCEELQELIDEARLLKPPPVLPTSIAPSSSALKAAGSHVPSSFALLLDSNPSQPPLQSQPELPSSSLDTTYDAILLSQEVSSRSQLSAHPVTSHPHVSVSSNTGITSVASDAFSVTATMQPPLSGQENVSLLGLSSITDDDSSIIMPTKTPNQILPLPTGISGSSSINKVRSSVSGAGIPVGINSEQSSAMIPHPSAKFRFTATPDSAVMTSTSSSDRPTGRHTNKQSLSVVSPIRPSSGTSVSAGLGSDSTNLGGSHSKFEPATFLSTVDISPSVTNAGISDGVIVTADITDIALGSLLLDEYDTLLTPGFPYTSTESTSILPSEASLNPQDLSHTSNSKASSVMGASHQTLTPHTTSRAAGSVTVHSQVTTSASNSRSTSRSSHTAKDVPISVQEVSVYEPSVGHQAGKSTTVEMIAVVISTYRAASSLWAPHMSMAQSQALPSGVTSPSAADRPGDLYTKPEESRSAPGDSRPMNIPTSLPAFTGIDGNQPSRSLSALSAMQSPGFTSERRMELVPTSDRGLSTSPPFILSHIAYNHTSRSGAPRTTASEVRFSTWPSGSVAMPPTLANKVSSTLATPSLFSHRKTFSLSPGSDMVPSIAPTVFSAASIIVSNTPSSPDLSFEPMIDQSSTADRSLLSHSPAATIHLTVEVTHTAFAPFPVLSHAFPCAQESDRPDFCLGSGCVNTLTNEEHCGKCNQLCHHKCHQGVCICPDLSTPDEKNRCFNGPGSGECVFGYTRNSAKVCASQMPTKPPGSSTTMMQATSVGMEAQLLSFVKSGRPAPVSAMAISTGYPELKSMPCPPALLDMCGGGCFDSSTENSHCRDCGISCSEVCIGGQCPSSSPMLPSQVVSPERKTKTSDHPRPSPVHSPLTSTVEPAALFIWRGIAGL